MQTLNRLRRAGVLITAALALAACQDGFFFDPAPQRVTPVVVQWEWLDAPVVRASSTPVGMEGAGALPRSAASSGAQGPQASPGAAFDKADGALVVLRAGGKDLFNQRVALEAAGSDKKVSFSVELPAGSAVQATLELTLQRGQDALFTGTATAQLTPGQAAEVSVPLSAVIARIVAGGPYTMRVIGGTLKLTAWGLFPTNDSTAVAATFSGLDPNVTVTSDGTVTAVSNGIGRVVASYLGRVDTARVTVEDRCFGPFQNLAVGQTVNGALDANDCLDAPLFAYNDWYFVTLPAPTLFRATLKSNGFETFVGANLPAAPRRELGVAADPGTEVVSEYYFPGGSYLVRAGSRARAAGPVPTGTYSLALTAETEPQRGCWQGANSFMATWLMPGGQIAANLSSDDCATSPGSSSLFDLYGVRLQPGDTAVVTFTGDAPFFSAAGVDARARAAAGGPVHWAFVSEAAQSHYFRIYGAPPVPYGLRVLRGIPSDYDACANPGIILSVPLSGVTTKAGRLQRRIDCEGGDRVRDNFSVPTPAEAIRTTLSSSEFDPFLAVAPPGRQGFGRASATGSVAAEWLFPAGRSYELRVLSAGLISSGRPVQGAYTLTAGRVSEPQNGCFAGTSSAAFVDFGSVARGRITSDDCRDLFAPDTATVTRWVDGYAILVQPGETVTVTFSADFVANFTRWVGATFAEARFGVAPGQTASFTITQPAGSEAAFHSFYAISGQDRATGSYTMSFSGTPNPAGPAGVSGADARERPELMVPLRR